MIQIPVTDYRIYEMGDWLVENIGPPQLNKEIVNDSWTWWYTYDLLHTRILAFSNDEDALAFKIRFGL